MKDCPDGKIMNPKTGRCVSINGPTGKKLLASKKPKTPKRKDCPDGKIMNPKTGRCVSINGPTGKKLVASQKPKTPKRNSSKIPKTFVSGSRYSYPFALNYIKDKHKECFIVPTKNSDLLEYNRNTLIWEDKTDIDVVRADLKNPIYDMYGNRVNNIRKTKRVKPDIGLLYVHNNISTKIKSCMKNKTRFIIIPIQLTYITRKSYHANMLIYDKKTKTAERYEPHGLPTELQYTDKVNSNLIDKSIREFLLDKKLIDRGEDYFGPLNMCPNWESWKSGKMGHQKLQELERKGFSGSCATWVIWYTDYRLSNPNLERDEAMEQSFKHLRDSSPSFTEFITKYFSLIYEYSLK